MNLIRNAVRMGFLSKLEGRRIWNELRLILLEDAPEKIIMRLEELGILPSIYQGLSFTEKTIRLFEEVRRIRSWYELLYKEKPCDNIDLYLIALMSDMGEKDVEGFLSRMEFGNKQKRKLQDDLVSINSAKIFLDKFGKMKKSEVASILRNMSQEAVLFLMALSEKDDSRKAISNFITTSSSVKPEITGDDLKSMGIREGPIFKELLQSVRDAKIDGILRTKEEEINYVLSLLRKNG
jgi:tRNA nucleotidyltransferase (CCA-adding enzyme)